MPGPWRKVKFAAECPECPDCNEAWCYEHQAHYGDCPCIGPTEDGVEYKMVGDVLYGRRDDDDDEDETIH